MRLTAAQLQQFYRCGELYRLATIEGVPLLPTSSEIVSRSVRDAIQGELAVKLATRTLRETPDARAELERIVRGHLAGETFLSDADALQGQRKRFEAVMLAAQRMLLLWRAVVAPKISCICRAFASPACTQHDTTGNYPTDGALELGNRDTVHSSDKAGASQVPRETSHLDSISRTLTLASGPHEIECFVEITEVSGSIRSTKVRSRRPEEGEASRDLSLALAALAIEQADGMPPAEATVDYLINTQEMQYVRQVVEFDAGMLAAAQERLKVAISALEEGSFVPAPADAWWCRACQLRPVCRYV